MARQIVLEFPFAPPPELRKNSHGANRWAIKEAKDRLKELAMAQLLNLGYGPSEAHAGDWQAAEVQYVSFFCGKPIDGVEFATGMGAALDCLSPEKINHRGGTYYVNPGIGLLVDDSPEYVTCQPAKYVRVKTRKEVKTIMIISEISETEWTWKGERT